VWVDFTVPAVVKTGVCWALEHRLVPLVGTTGMDSEDRAELAALAERTGTGCLIAPNFALGAVLLMKFAAEAARYFPAAEIIELHHERKVDAPSGTARLTADRMTAARLEAGWTSGPIEAGDEAIAGVRGGACGSVRVHSVRLPGLLAHQEVLLGGTGEVLTLRHDSLSRESFMPGVVLAIRKASSIRGLVVGLEQLL
jgi:4-hydroxy-tetrahydrodipicolinate reductase